MQKLNNFNPNILLPTSENTNLSVQGFFKFFEIKGFWPKKNVSYIGTQLCIVTLAPKPNFKSLFKYDDYVIRLFEEDFLYSFQDLLDQDIKDFLELISLEPSEFHFLLKSIMSEYL